ncbi:MAG TPA: purine-nucleoside phosphorylase [Acidobacteriaceae bacterium]|jgi:purine-nucleoside phosphorylase|nr:purine-nucleoside phosphorylase [Acidobacteriaceae bacterium]
MTQFDRSSAAADFLLVRTPLRPRIAIVLGSGLGAFAGELENATAISFAEIPHFPQSTVPGHSGRLVIGTVAGVPVAVMQGRVHAYEGYSSEEVTFPVRVLGRMGITQLVLTNAAGGINPAFHQGQLVVLSDHINLSGRNPVAGKNEDRFGPRFFDMSEAYSARLRNFAHDAARGMDFRLDEGVYLSVLGSSFETPAEIRAFAALGADLVGMSTVQETIVARHMGMEVLGISCVTNMAAGIQKEPLSHEEVMATGKAVEARLAGLLARIVPLMASGRGAQ